MNCPSCHIQEGDYTKGCNTCDDRVRAAYAANDDHAEDPPKGDGKWGPTWLVVSGLAVILTIYVAAAYALIWIGHWLWRLV